VASSPSPAGPTTSAPPPFARLLAVVAIVVGGLCGGLIGYAVTDLQCDDGCTVLAGFVGLASAVAGAVGIAIVAVLALRAMAEWNEKEIRERAHRDDHP
jgi:hypothetical protein